MSRFVLLSSLAALTFATAACNPATAKDRSIVWTDMIEVEEGLWGRGINLGAAVGPQVRDMDTTMEIRLSVSRPEGVEPNVEMLLLSDLNNPRSARTSEGTAEIVIDGGFSGCDGAGFRIRDDGGCDYEAGLLVTSDQYQNFTINYSVKAFAADDWAGDEDSLEVIAQASAADPE